MGHVRGGGDAAEAALAGPGACPRKAAARDTGRGSASEPRVGRRGRLKTTVKADHTGEKQTEELCAGEAGPESRSVKAVNPRSDGPGGKGRRQTTGTRNEELSPDELY